MARTQMTPEDIARLNAAQVEFGLNPRFIAPQIKHFALAQDSILGEVEKFSSAWFKRRKDATQSLIDASRRIASEGQVDPSSLMKEIVDWQVHSMERLAEDAKDCTELLSGCTGAFVQNEAGPTAEGTATVKPAKKAS